MILNIKKIYIELSKFVSFALFIFLFGSCDDDKNPLLGVPSTDDDGDGFSEDDGDCDDNNNTIFPGAQETSFDGIDSNCDDQDLPQLSDNLLTEEIINIIDIDEDGNIYETNEFDILCSESAMIEGEANPGIIQIHVSCSGTNSCRGMILHEWNEIIEHDCRGVNYCNGMSCVETSDNENRTGVEIFNGSGNALGLISCTTCHWGDNNSQFGVLVPPNENIDDWVDTFWDIRSDDELRASIAFGIQGIDQASGHAYSNMPEYFNQLSRSEIDSVIQYIKTLELIGRSFSYPDLRDSKNSQTSFSNK